MSEIDNNNSDAEPNADDLEAAAETHVEAEVQEPSASEEPSADVPVDQDDESVEAQDDDDAPSEPVHIPNLSQIIEGAVLAADKPLSIDHIMQLFPDGEPSRAQVREAIAEIQVHCEGRGYQLKEVASGYRFQVRAEYGDWIGRLWEERAPRYTRALLETLALIAYKQPITRGDIEDIRGVAVSTNIIRTLLEREWVRIVGHRDVPGRPSIYATTKTFLDYFELNSLDELPTLSDIKDLDKLNEELDLDQALIEPRTLNLEVSSEEIEGADADDETLNEVTDRVNEIQQNIKNLFKEPEEEDDFDEASDVDVEVSAAENDEAEIVSETNEADAESDDDLDEDEDDDEDEDEDDDDEDDDDDDDLDTDSPDRTAH